MTSMRRPFLIAALAATLSCATTTTSSPQASAPPGRAERSATPDTAAFVEGLAIARRFRADRIATRRFTHAELWSALAGPSASSRLSVRPIGRSLQGREIRAVTFGSGPVRVLLWSQMHGDESTATMAIADILQFLAADAEHPLRTRLTRSLTVTFVPMLNPDGAELFQRENAVGIDVNRDARMLSTPEARALKALRDSIRPDFGFNLHDQGARTRVGTGGPQAGIALLAPAYDEDRSWNDVRTKARHLAAVLASLLAREIPGRVARYDDTFNPRAFGDLVQQWGTSTVLIESGALPDDPQKQRLRALNAALILAALDAIAGGRLETVSTAAYDDLPMNAGGANDLLVLGAQLVIPGATPLRADVAINFDDAVARSGGRLREVGDLRHTIAIDTLDASGLFLHAAPTALTRRGDQTWLRIGAPAAFELRRGADAGSPLVRRIGDPDGE